MNIQIGSFIERDGIIYHVEVINGDVVWLAYNQTFAIAYINGKARNIGSHSYTKIASLAELNG